MAYKFAIANGNFNDSTIWSLSPTGTIIPTTVPAIGDIAFANRCLVVIDNNIECDLLTNISASGTTPAAGQHNFALSSVSPTFGMFQVNTFNNPVTIRAGINTECRTTVPSVCAIGTNTLDIYGVVRGGPTWNFAATRTNYSFINNNEGNTNITGMVVSGRIPTDFGVNFSPADSNTGAIALRHNSRNGILTINGTVSGSTQYSGEAQGSNRTLELYGPTVIRGNVNGHVTAPNISTATVYYDGNTANNNSLTIYGNVVGGTGVNSSATNWALDARGGNVNIYGNILAPSTGYHSVNISGAVSVFNVYGNIVPLTLWGIIADTSTHPCAINVFGNVRGSVLGGGSIYSSHTNAEINITGNVLNAPNGNSAVTCRRWGISPPAYDSYIRYADNGMGVGDNAFLYMYQTYSLSAFTVPGPLYVRVGESYLGGLQVGLINIPPASAVCIGVPFDNSNVGTSFVDYMEFFDTPVTILNSTGTIGEVVKYAARNSLVGELIEGFY